MPRPPKPFMVPQPLEPLNLEEIKFWLHIMEEHTLFIRSGLPCEETGLINEAQAFCQEFAALRARAERVQSDKKFIELVQNSIEAVKGLYRYKRHLLHRMLTCRLAGYNFPLLLDHTAREAQYFLQMLEIMKTGRSVLDGSAKAKEDMFWLRIMADHAKFICHLLDPSERNLIETANCFSVEFDGLFLQSRDFASMQSHYPEIMAFHRFLLDVKAAVLRLRDFKKAARDLIAECRLVGLIPEQLADHVRREADHFLMILSMMEKGLIKCTMMDEPEPMADMVEMPPMEEYMGFPEDTCCMEEREEPPQEPKNIKVAPVPPREPVKTAEKAKAPKFVKEEEPVEVVAEEREQEEIDPEIEPPLTSIVPPPAVKAEKAQSAPVLTAQAATPAIKADSKEEKKTTKKNNGKYSWADKWPRPLGKK